MYMICITIKYKRVYNRISIVGNITMYYVMYYLNNWRSIKVVQL